MNDEITRVATEKEKKSKYYRVITVIISVQTLITHLISSIKEENHFMLSVIVHF